MTYPSHLERIGKTGRVLSALIHDAMSEPKRRMILGYGDTGCSVSSDSQTRKPQLGPSDSAGSCAGY